LKFREIAKILDIPEATAKSRYRYAIEHIQNSLNR
jgi:DNA-directed RNA polymerase specialized sigma24 family protein